MQPNDEHVARILMATAGLMVKEALHPTNMLQSGAVFRNEFGEVQILPIVRAGERLVRISCDPKSGRSWGAEFTTHAPQAEWLLQAALRNIFWRDPGKSL